MKQLSAQVKIKREPGFNIVSFVVTLFLMLSFLGAIMYVLISSM
ncbi:MAG: hypothetical protein ACXVBJ_12120 [Flavisolibacter sp.]